MNKVNCSISTKIVTSSFFSPSPLLAHLPEEILLYIFDFLDGPSLARSSSVCSVWFRIADERNLWGRLCVRSTYKFSNMDNLIINYIPGVWGRIFYEKTSSGGNLNSLAPAADHKNIDLKTLFTRLWAAQQNKCGFCFKNTSSWHLNHILIKICPPCCKNKEMFITKTEAKKHFFLKSEEDFDKLFCFISHNRKYYFMKDVRSQAISKFGDETGFQLRYRQYSERSQKIKLAKEMRQVQRKRDLSRSNLVVMGVKKDRITKRITLTEERAKYSLLFMEFMQNSPTVSVRDIIQWFNINTTA